MLCQRNLHRGWSWVVVACTLAYFLANSVVTRAADAAKPNIVVIFSDDQGYGDVGCYGCTDIRTPALDGLARQGVRFTNYYANAPECTPTRTAFLTGRYQQRVGGMECALGFGHVGRYDDAIRLRAQNELGLPASETSLGQLLKKAGYATAVCGKWHLGYVPKFSPNRHGFDYAFYTLGGGVDYFHHTEPDGTPMLYLNEKPIQREGYMTDLITEEAVGFLRRQRDKPFFLYVPYTAPHTPYQGPSDKSPKHKTLEEFNIGTRAKYAEMVERMDRGIGKILKTLDDRGLAKNTLLIFASDNGANDKGRNYPFRGFKSGTFEGGIRVPAIVRWPGVLTAGKTTDQATITLDFSKSILRAAGAPPPKGRKLDGIDVLQRLSDSRPTIDRTLFWRQRRGDLTWRAVRDGSMKYVSRTEGDKFQEYVFDLASDPAEKHNLLAKDPKTTGRLKSLLTAWEKEVRPAR